MLMQGFGQLGFVQININFMSIYKTEMKKTFILVLKFCAMTSLKSNFLVSGMLSIALFCLSNAVNGQVIEKVKETTMGKVEEKAVEKSEELSDAIFEKIENIFKKKKKVEDEEVEKPEKKQEVEEQKTVKKTKQFKSS